MAELFDTPSDKAQTDGASLVGSADQQSSKQMSASSREALAQQFLLTQSSLKPAAAADNTYLVSRPADSNNSLVGDFLYSAAYAGLQTPASGVGQLIDKVAGTNIEKNVHFMSAPTEAKFGSANWHAQQLGGGVGMIAPFLVTAAGTRWGLGKVGLAAEGSGLLGAAQIAKNAKGLAVLEGAASGFVFDFATRPVQDGEGNFWASRLKHGVTGAATFGTLTASTIGLRALGGSAAAEVAGARKVLTNIGIGTASGLPAGFVAAESNSLLTHGKFASTEEVGKSMYTMGFVGGALTGLHQIPGQRKSFADTVVEQAAARDRATNLQNILATRSVKAETAATTSDASGLMLTGRDAGATGRGSLIERLLPKANEGSTRFALGDLVVGNRRFASDVEAKSDFTIEVPRPELKPVLEQRVTQAYKVAGLDGKATTAEIADFFKWAETVEGVELRTAMGQVSDVVASQKLNTILLEAYLPREGVEHRVVGNEKDLESPHKIKLRIQHAPTEAQKAKWTEFFDMNLSPPKDAEGYAQFREGIFKWLNETAADPNLKTLQEWAREYNDQGSNSLSSGPLDYYFGTTNLNRFVEVYNGQRPPVEVREIEPRLIVDEAAEARIAAEEAAVKTTGVRPPFDVQARLNSFETSTGKAKVTDAVLLADYTGMMSEAQFNKWIEYVTNPPAGSEATMLRSMITKGDVLKRPEVQKAISNEKGATTPEAGDITLSQVREFLAQPKVGEVKPMPEWMKDYIEMRIQIASMTAKPDAQPHQILDAALPRWLSENIKSKYTKPVEVKGEAPQYSEMLPQEFVQWFEAARQSRPPGKPERQFTPDKNDFAYRADKLDQALKVEDTVIRENLLRLAPQDHSVLRSVLQKLDPEKSAAEYKELMQIILPKTENMQDMKLLFDVMFFGNRANQNSRPRKPMPGKPETPPEQIERAIEETKAHQQLASLLLESMVPSTDAKFARASEIVDGIITGKYRDPRPAFDAGPGGKPGAKPGGFGDRDGGRFGPRDVDNGSRARRTLEGGGGEKKNAGTERGLRSGRVRLDEGTTDQTTQNDRGGQNVLSKERVDDGAVAGAGGAEKGVVDKGVVDKGVLDKGVVDQGLAEPVVKADAEPAVVGSKVVDQVEQRVGEDAVVAGPERVVTEPQRVVKDDRVAEEAVVTDTNNGGNGQVVIEPPVEFREPPRKGGRRREQFEEEGDGYGERDRRNNDRKKDHRGREHRRNRGGGKDWRNLGEWDE